MSYVECQFDPSIICYVFVKRLVTVYLKAERDHPPFKISRIYQV